LEKTDSGLAAINYPEGQAFSLQRQWPHFEVEHGTESQGWVKIKKEKKTQTISRKLSSS